MFHVKHSLLSTKNTGNLGEELVVRFLKKGGFLIRERNYWRKWGEIDVVAERKNILHFVEVKARITSSPDPQMSYRAEENVHPKKLERLFRTIETYLLEDGENRDWQLDIVVVSIDPETKKASIRRIENVVG